MAIDSFPPWTRLRNSKEFDEVFQRNQIRVSKPEFLILALSNQHEHSRLGMVISKKVTPKAVDRNRIKRLIRESFRHHDPGNLDIVVLSRKAINTLDNGELSAKLDAGFNQLSAAMGKS